MLAFRRISQAVALALTCALVACTPGGGSGGVSTSGNRIVTPPPGKPSSATATPNPAATPEAAGAATSTSATRLRGEGMSAAELYTAYRAILDTYVDPVDNTQLVAAATDGLRQGLNGQATLPLSTMPLLLVGGLTGNADRDWQTFGDAYDSLRTKLPDWTDQTHPDWMVLRSMAESLHDSHTIFLTPDEAKRSRETSFAGIGVVMSRPQDNQTPLIAEIFPNSPAASSGLKRGDRIVSVDGQDVSGQNVGDIATLIRGQPGTTVRIGVTRLGESKPLEFTMKRATVQVEQVIGRQVPSAPIGYLRIRSFVDVNVVEQVLSILDQGRQRGLRAWVVDLRGNGGGALPAVLGVAAGFVNPDQTVIGYQIDRQRRQTPLETPQPINLLRSAAVAVIVDHDTGSGAEILAGALQEDKIATIVGAKTAGNVAVATPVTLPDDSILQVTQERFVSPSGAQLDGVGVTPDVTVDLTDEDLQADHDPQLAKALEIIVQKLTSPQG